MAKVLLYSIDRRSRFGRWFRKVARAIVAVIAISSLIYFSYSGYVCYLQRRCLNFAEPAGTIIFTSDPRLIAKLPRDHYVIVGNEAWRCADMAWQRYGKLRFSNAGAQLGRMPLFVGTLRKNVPGKEVVAIYPMGGSGPMGLGMLEMSPRTMLSPPLQERFELWQLLNYSRPIFKWVTFYQGTYDPRDASSFDLPFDSNSGPGTLKITQDSVGLIDFSWTGSNFEYFEPGD